MNGRKLYREYAQSKGKEAKEFIRIDSEGYGYSDYLMTKDNKGNLEKTMLDYKDVINWIIKTK